MENTTTPDGAETETETVSAAVSEPELVEPQQPEELIEVEEEDDAEEVGGSGVVSGAFALTALAFGVASLTGSWLGTVYSARAEYVAELKEKTQTTQASLDAFHSGWHAQAALGGIFALAALLFGAGVLASPSLLLSGRTPTWARAAALGGIIIGAVGLLLAILGWFNVIAPGLTAPASS
jgi:proteasome assembly chaperone (PAC2) family protein